MDGLVKTILRIIKHKGFFYVNHNKPQSLGRKIVILGNGPSAAQYKLNRDRFKKYDLLVVNFYPTKEVEFWNLRPEYLCLLDPKLFDLKDPYFDEEGHHERKSDIEDLYKAIEKIDWKIKIVTIGNRTLPVRNSNIEYIRLVTSCCGFDIGKFEAKVFFNNWAIPRAQNVINCALYFAEMFGYKEIALFGVEQNWLQTLVVDENNMLYTRCEHFYGKENSLPVSSSYESEMLDVILAFKGFSAAAKLADCKNIDIVNYAYDSYLQCFKKCKLVS